MTDWLQNLKVGDEVVVQNGWNDGVYRKSAVSRTTKTLVFIGGTGFRKRDGCEAGGDWHCNVILEPTPDNLTLARVSTKIGVVKNMFRHLNVEGMAEGDLDKLIEVLREIRKA